MDIRDELQREYDYCRARVREVEEELVYVKLQLQRAETALDNYKPDPPSPPPSTSATNEPPRDGVGG